MYARWMSDAACRGEDPELFFPEHGVYRDALAICAVCPVTTECLAHALKFEVMIGSVFGVWGNTLPSQRLKIVKQTISVQMSRKESDSVA